MREEDERGEGDREGGSGEKVTVNEEGRVGGWKWQ